MSWTDIPAIWEVKQDITWLIDDLLAEGSLTLLAADSGTGKTWVTTAIAGAIAHGSPFLGRKTQCRPVLYIDGENPSPIAQRNLNVLRVQPTTNLTYWGIWMTEFPPVIGPTNQCAVDFAKQTKGLIIVDSLIHFHPGDESNASETRRYMNQFRALTAYGATVLVIHHTGKGPSSQDFRGSSDIKAAVDTAFKLECTERRHGLLWRLRLDAFKCRYNHIDPIYLELTDDAGFVQYESLNGSRRMGTDAREFVIALLTNGQEMNQKQIIAAAKGRVERAAIIAAIADDSTFAARRGKGREFLYSLRNVNPK